MREMAKGERNCLISEARFIFPTTHDLISSTLVGWLATQAVTIFSTFSPLRPSSFSFPLRLEEEEEEEEQGEKASAAAAATTARLVLRSPSLDNEPVAGRALYVGIKGLPSLSLLQRVILLPFSSVRTPTNAVRRSFPC